MQVCPSDGNGLIQMPARFGSLIIWLALIPCAVMNFTGTIILCLTSVGIGWAGWYLSETITLMQGTVTQEAIRRRALTRFPNFKRVITAQQLEQFNPVAPG
jgi:hypothetical protein